MRSKNILSIAAFFIAFTVSAALASLFIPDQTVTANAISVLLRQDIRNGNERDRNIYNTGTDSDGSFKRPSLEKYSEIIGNYVNASERLHTGQLPSDFTEAWQKHMKAWRDYSDFLNDMKDYFGKNNENNKLFCAFEKRYDDEISKTWYEVLRIAENYGSDIE